MICIVLYTLYKWKLCVTFERISSVVLCMYMRPLKGPLTFQYIDLQVRMCVCAARFAITVAQFDLVSVCFGKSAIQPKYIGVPFYFFHDKQIAFSIDSFVIVNHRVRYAHTIYKVINFM